MEGLKGVGVEVKNENSHDQNSSTLPSEDVPQKGSEVEEPKESTPPSPKPYMLPLPFPQRFAKAKFDS